MPVGGDEGFLPPEPPGPEPELGKRPGPRPAQPGPEQWAAAAPPAAGGQPPPQWPPPAPGQQWQQPPPGWAPPPGQWQQPPAPGWAQPQQQAWAYPSEPDNNSAVTGFVLAMVSLGLWLFSLGLSSLLSLGLAIGGLFASRSGKRKLAAGKTRKHRGLSQAGFISNIVMIVLSGLSTAAWAAFWIVFATDESFRDDLEDGNGDGFGDNSISASVRLAALAARLTATLLG
jgi:hypothetical protein